MLELNEFLDLVIRMRQLQKEWHKTKDRKIMIETIKLEREVDNAIEVYENTIIDDWYF